MTILLFLFTGISSLFSESPFDGTWETTIDRNSFTAVMNFNIDYTFETEVYQNEVLAGTEHGFFSYDETTITISYSDTIKVIFNFELFQDSLLLKDKDDNLLFSLKKK